MLIPRECESPSQYKTKISHQHKLPEAQFLSQSALMIKEGATLGFHAGTAVDILLEP
jgi:hypothetical protein